MIEVTDLTKRYGHVTAVDDLGFTARPGHVTGFLGPNGAGNPATELTPSLGARFTRANGPARHALVSFGDLVVSRWCIAWIPSPAARWR